MTIAKYLNLDHLAEQHILTSRGFQSFAHYRYKLLSVFIFYSITTRYVHDQSPIFKKNIAKYTTNPDWLHKMRNNELIQYVTNFYDMITSERNKKYSESKSDKFDMFNKFDIPSNSTFEEIMESKGFYNYGMY